MLIAFLQMLFTHETLLRAAGAEDLPPNIENNDWIYYPNWPTPVKVIDQNWAIRAVALQLGTKGGIVVWPMRICCRRCIPPTGDN